MKSARTRNIYSGKVHLYDNGRVRSLCGSATYIEPTDENVTCLSCIRILWWSEAKETLTEGKE